VNRAGFILSAAQGVGGTPATVAPVLAPEAILARYFNDLGKPDLGPAWGEIVANTRPGTL